MSKHCKTFDHTADVGLEARADTLAELYEALAAGMAELICTRSSVVPAETRTLAVAAEDREALAVDFLAEVLGLVETERLMVASVKVRMSGETALTATVRCEAYNPGRHEIRTEVKAVTYHMLSVVEEGGHWTGTVVLDL